LEARLRSLNYALLFICLYFVPATTGILYPGANWTDPEFGEGRAQMFMFPMIIGIGAAGWWIERLRVMREMSLKAR